MIDEYDQNVHFVEIDIEEDPEVAEAAGIMGTPCVQFFKNKEMLRLVHFHLGSLCSVCNNSYRIESMIHEVSCYIIREFAYHYCLVATCKNVQL